MTTQNGARALIEPFGRHADLARRWPSTIQSPLKHSHAVGRCGIGGMHGLAVIRAALVCQPRPADQTASWLVGMIDRWKDPPSGTAPINLVIRELFRSEIVLHCVRKCGPGSQRSLR